MCNSLQKYIVENEEFILGDTVEKVGRPIKFEHKFGVLLTKCLVSP